MSPGPSRVLREHREHRPRAARQHVQSAISTATERVRRHTCRTRTRTASRAQIRPRRSSRTRRVAPSAGRAARQPPLHAPPGSSSPPPLRSHVPLQEAQPRRPATRRMQQHPSSSPPPSSRPHTPLPHTQASHHRLRPQPHYRLACVARECPGRPPEIQVCPSATSRSSARLPRRTVSGASSMTAPPFFTHTPPCPGRGQAEPPPDGCDGAPSPPRTHTHRRRTHRPRTTGRTR